MSIKKNFIYNLSYQILTLILPLVTAPYLSRVLGADQIGQYSYTYSVAGYFVLFSMLGVNNYGNRSVASHRDDRNSLSCVFYSIYYLQLITSAIVILVYVIYAFCSASNVSLAIIWIPYIVSAAMDINWLFFGLECFKITVTRNFIIKILSFLMIILFVKGEYALPIYCTIMSFSQLVSCGVLWTFVPKYVDPFPFKWRCVSQHILPNIKLFIPVIAISVYNILDKVMLGSLSSMEQTGFFESAQKVATMPLTLITALGTVMLPHTSNLIASGNASKAKALLSDSIWFAMLLSAAFCFGIIGIAPTLATVYFGTGFEPTAILMAIIVMDMPFMAWANVIRTQLLIPASRDNAYVSSVVMGAVVNVAINILTIPSLGAFGASLGTLFAEMTVCFIQTVSVRSEIPVLNWVKSNMPYFVIGALMCLFVRVIGFSLGVSITTLVIQIICGIVSYLVLTLLYLILTDNQFYIKYIKHRLVRVIH